MIQLGSSATRSVRMVSWLFLSVSAAVLARARTHLNCGGLLLFSPAEEDLSDPGCANWQEAP